jgi:hypothetical protein
VLRCNAEGPGEYGDGRNLQLHATKTSSRRWLISLGRDRMRGLGSCRKVTLE